jgi:DNA repair protein RecO (recombination protein O)
MTHTTSGIVLRTVKYGETSVIATIYTSKFGLQSYLVNGVRKSSAKGSKAIMLQPAALLDLEVYHSDLKNLQRIKELSWAHLYQQLYNDVVRNSVATFMVELLTKVFRQPESNEDLYLFIEDAFLSVDQSAPEVTANFAIWFALQLPQFFGLQLQEAPAALIKGDSLYLDLMAGQFTTEQPQHPQYLEGEWALIIADLLKVMQPTELAEFKLKKEARRTLLHALLQFYQYHFQDFGTMRSLKIMQEVLDVS